MTQFMQCSGKVKIIGRETEQYLPGAGRVGRGRETLGVMECSMLIVVVLT